jgi:drug/metabolite transporter (DMT)-like permease
MFTHSQRQVSVPAHPAVPASDANGIFLIMMSETFLAIVNTIVKYVHGWSTQKMMIVRNTTDLGLCLLMCLWCKNELPGRKISLLLVLRGISYIMFISLFWASLRSCLPLGDVILLVVTFSPTLFVLLARIQLGEQIPRTWPVQFTMCCIGAVLINKPGVPDRNCPASTAMLPLAGAFCAGFMNLASRNVKGVPVVFSCVFNDMVALVFAIVTGGAFSTASGITASLPERIDVDFCLVVAAGVVGWLGLMLNVQGYQSVSTPAVASIAAYISVALGYGIQVSVFGEPVDPMSLAGATLITATNIASIIYKQYEERRTPPPQEQYKLLPEEGEVKQEVAGA